MNQAEMSPLEQVLRFCAEAAPQPWFPRVFARRTGASKDNLSLIIEHLLLDGLLERTAGNEETGPGLVLSSRGAEVLRDPQALERLRQGLPIAAGDRGGVVREALRRRQTPYVSRALLGLNLLVFAYGIILSATNGGAWQTYLTGLSGDDSATYRRFLGVIQSCGSITAESWLRGDWWRTLTACFVHFGLLHLFMNMYMLYVSGGFLEQMWGRTRFLVIYLIAGVVGTCVGLAHNTTIMELNDVRPAEEMCVPLAGASTALCGIIAAEAVWVWLNGRFLPRSLSDRWRNNLMIQVVMIVFISFFPGISGWGHFGGAVGGALAALLLHFHRFGPSPWRWAALVGLVPLPLLGYAEIQRMRMSRQKVVFLVRLSDTSWAGVEELDYKKRFESQLRTKMTPEEQKEYGERVEPLLDMDAGRREESKKAEVKDALALLGRERQEWSGFLDTVNHAGPYYQPAAEKLRNEDRDAITAHLKLFELAEKCLREGKQWRPEDETALRNQRQLVKEGKPKDEPPQSSDKDPEIKLPVKGERAAFKKEYLDKLVDTSNTILAANAGWDNVNSEVLKEPKNRREKVVAARLEEAQAQRRPMSDLAEKLDKAGPYKDEELEALRNLARDSRRAWATLLEQAETCLRDGEPWKGEEQEKRARKLQQDLRDALREMGWIN